MEIKKYSWEEILNSNLKELDLFGYGSLLNHFSHDYEIKTFDKVILQGYKRVFNINHPIEMIEERDQRYFNISKLLNEDYLKPFNRMSLNNRGGLNIVKTNHNLDRTNGAILKIERKDFETLAERESIYDLYFEEVITYEGKRTTALVLVSPEEILSKGVLPYYLYYKSCRHGSYMISQQFGEDFDKTTFNDDLKTLTIDWFLKKYFPVGSKVKLVSFKFSQNIECDWKLTKNYNKILKVIGKKNNFILVENSNGDTLTLDSLDLSPILKNY